MASSGKQRITGRKTVWEHNSRRFRVDELTVESDAAQPIQWASFERGDAVAALIVNTDTNHVMLVRQFRPPVAAIEGPEHKLLETVAGMIRQNEEPLHCLQREIEEETGYQLAFDRLTGGIKDTELICEFYTSPGGSSERIYLYYVAVDGTTPKNPGGGIKEHGEDIETVLMPLDEFFESIDRAVFKDAKIMIAGQWLAKRWGNLRADRNIKEEFALKQDLEAAGPRRTQPRIVGLYTTDIGEVRDVDVWVNSSNTEFLMDTIYHGTLSARIRTLGAKLAGDVLVEDTIQQALVRRLGVGKGLDISNVLDTTPGSLSESHNVRCLLHVASVKARVQPNGFAMPVTGIQDLQRCVVRTLEKCDELNARLRQRVIGPYRSILLLLFGAGIDRDPTELKTKRICDALIPAAISYLQQHPHSRIERVYFLAYTPNEIEICHSVMSRQQGLIRINRAAPTPAQSDLPKQAA
jgi:ADP-ribose pyrophosphatase